MATVLLVCAAAALFFTLSSCQAIPEVALDDSNCPVGPGVKGVTILIGTEATCRCVVRKQGDSSTQARWFRQDNTTVGAVNGADGSSVLTFSFNVSDDYPSFECRPITTPLNAGKGVPYIPQFRSLASMDIIHGMFIFGEDAPRNVNTITWQAGNNGKEVVNISTCNIRIKICNDLIPEFYKASVGDSGSGRLSINIPRVNETQFSFLADNGLRSTIVELEIYGQPALMTCRQNFTPTYVDFTCTAQQVYPSIIAELHREKEDFNQSDFVGNLTCIYGRYRSDRYGDYNVSCNWRIKMKSMWTESTLTAYMSLPVSNVSVIPDTPVTFTTTIKYAATRVELAYQCASTHGDLIKRDAKAKCKCQKFESDTPVQARWYTNDSVVVGDEDPSDGSSTLTFSFNASDPEPTYTCTPFTELQAPLIGVTYMPKFSSSMPQSLLTGLGPMIIVLGVLLSGIVSS